MTLIQKLTILLVTTYSFDCINYRNITNKKLHDDILDYFFSHGNTKFENFPAILFMH